MLSLSTSTKSENPYFSLPQRLVWDPKSTTERDEAIKKIASLTDKGFVVQNSIEGECLLNPPARPRDLFICRVLDPTGDSRLVWNKNSISEINEAKQKFNDYLKKGYKAYACRRDGSKGARLDSFDALMEELLVEKGQPEGIMVPPTSPG
jgi:hypothetical protein